ncbi:hypothetical protein K435DRAFT_284734 [Dendrothele bispora CBS 962.96]|uniref:Uncharacterized protein n=1 Tax=Dendrothele bispora (strain CBS 962.96) TaxID=1314807 RepID=A0A4S8LK70_DENBC|nr:hypothetical protein K435DRAFT_284734 [Dendrothele bispora CBS 962.96]
MICFGPRSGGEMGSPQITDALTLTIFDSPQGRDKPLPFDLLFNEAHALEYLWGIPKTDSLSQEMITVSLSNLLGYTSYKTEEIEKYKTLSITVPSILLETAGSFITVAQFKNLDESYSCRADPWCRQFGSVFCEEERELLESGWTRFHYGVGIWGKGFSFEIRLPQSEKILSSWLCQAMSVANTAGDNASRLKAYVGAQIFLNPEDMNMVIHPNIIPRDIFLFIAPVSLKRCQESGSTTVNWVEHRENLYYWSFDPDGFTRISEKVCNLIGLPKYKTILHPVPVQYHDYQFQAIQSIQEFMGYDPLSSDFAQACGLPLLETISPSENQDKPFGMCHNLLKPVKLLISE